MSEIDVKEERAHPRFVFPRSIDVTFSNYPVKLCNIGAGGAQIEHAGVFKPHSSSNLKIPLPRSNDVIALRATVIWSKLSGTPNAGGKLLYRSGVRFDQVGSAVSATVQRVITIFSGSEDKQSIERKREMLVERAKKGALRQESQSLESTWRRLPPTQRTVDPEKKLMIQQTLARLQKEPDQIPRLANRARNSLDKKGGGVGHDEAALAVWQYLEHLVPLEMIAEVLSKK